MYLATARTEWYQQPTMLWGSRFFPRWAFTWEPIPEDECSSARHETETPAKLCWTPGPRKLWDNKCVAVHVCVCGNLLCSNWKWMQHYPIHLGWNYLCLHSFSISLETAKSWSLPCYLLWSTPPIYAPSKLWYSYFKTRVLRVQ